MVNDTAFWGRSQWNPAALKQISMRWAGRLWNWRFSLGGLQRKWHQSTYNRDGQVVLLNEWEISMTFFCLDQWTTYWLVLSFVHLCSHRPRPSMRECYLLQQWLPREDLFSVSLEDDRPLMLTYNGPSVRCCKRVASSVKYSHGVCLWKDGEFGCIWVRMDALYTDIVSVTFPETWWRGCGSFVDTNRIQVILWID